MASLTISDQHYVLHKLTSPEDGMSKWSDQRPPARKNNQPVIYVACHKTSLHLQMELHVSMYHSRHGLT